MTLAPPRPAGLDPDLLAVAARDTRGSLTLLVGGDVLTYRVVDGAVREDAAPDGDTASGSTPPPGRTSSRSCGRRSTCC